MIKKLYKKIICLSIAILFLLYSVDFAYYNPKNPDNMYWKAYGDGTFAWIPKDDTPPNVVKQGAWYQLAEGVWVFYMSTDGGNIFTPLKSCSAYINFNDNPFYNLYTFNEDGILIGSDYKNLLFPPQMELFINIYASNIQLRMQPGGICVQEGTIIRRGEKLYEKEK